MIKSKGILLTACLLMIMQAAFSQASEGKYIVLTFEDTYKISQHGTTSHYWILPLDSLTSRSTASIAHLFLNEYSKDNIEDCCAGKPVDPFLVTKGANYELDAAQYDARHTLEQLLAKKRKRIQQISKQWTAGQKEEITIFATPIYGKFCSSSFHPIGTARTGYSGKVYIPLSSFAYIADFWESAAAREIMTRDFSKVDFAVIPY